MEPVQQKVVEWLLEEGGHITPADYQRAYSWPESLVAAFVEDLIDSAVHPASGAPDIGVVVVECGLEGSLSDGRSGERIADGQQRLMTFALLLAEVLQADRAEALFGKSGSDVSDLALSRQNRLHSLLFEPARNLQTVLHARRALRQIHAVLHRADDWRKLDAPKRLERLGQTTFSLVSFPRSAGEAPDAGITHFFETVNLTAKPLNGGQILKALHMGFIREKCPEETWQKQARYDAWFRTGEPDRELALDAATLRSINWKDRIPLDRFVDSPDDDARYRPGCGFMQAVQGLLLELPMWWMEVAEQGGDRLKPFDRLEGSLRVRPGCVWRADEPLEFAAGEGFFSLTNRFVRLYEGFCQALLRLPNIEKYSSLRRAPAVVLKPLPAADALPGELVCEASAMLGRFGEVLRKWSRVGENLQTPGLGSFCTYEKNSRKEVRPEFAEPASWLLVPTSGGRLHQTYAFIPCAVFATALCWCDRWTRRPDGGDEYVVLEPVARAAILDVLIYQILFARIQAVWKSVCSALAVPQAVRAARLSSDAEGAQWLFFKTALQSWDESRRLREFDQLFEKLSNETAASATDAEKAAIERVRAVVSAALRFVR